MTLGGTIPALLTPLTRRGAKVDLGLLDAHVAWLHGQGIRCVSPLGTTGEGQSLSLAERKEVVERLARHPSRMAFLPGTGRDALPEAVELSLHALEHGAAGVLVLPPWYYAPSAPATTAWFDALLRALPGDARVFAYHIPTFTRVPLTDETLTDLRARHGQKLAGVKDSGGDFGHTLDWLRSFPELVVLNGSDATAADHYASGGRGTLTMLANVVPGELERIRAGDDVERRQMKVRRLRELVDSFPRHAALKHVLQLVSGLPRSFVRPPLVELDAAQERELEARFRALETEAVA